MLGGVPGPLLASSFIIASTHGRIVAAIMVGARSEIACTESRGFVAQSRQPEWMPEFNEAVSPPLFMLRPDPR
jgi:hypothetical protein